ncbi:MAG: hypothetical protein HY098_00440 [Nitrospinae bacterium]|nr:hypothetical protein [Nitrospinota bacterium]
MKRYFLFPLLAFVLSAGAASALPLKIISAPSTDVQPYGTFHLGIENDTTMFAEKGVGGHSNPTDFGLLAGIANLGPFQVDAGLDIREQTDKPFSFNAKVATAENALGKWGPVLAFGAYDVGTEKGVNDFDVFYAEVSKTFGFIGRGTAGYYVGNAAMMKSATGETQNNGLILAFDRRMTEINEKLWLGVDYMGGKSLYGAVSFGLGWSFSEKASLVVGYVRYNDVAIATPTGASSGAGANVVTWQAYFDF